MRALPAVSQPNGLPRVRGTLLDLFALRCAYLPRLRWRARSCARLRRDRSAADVLARRFFIRVVNASTCLHRPSTRLLIIFSSADSQAWSVVTRPSRTSSTVIKQDPDYSIESSIPYIS